MISSLKDSKLYGLLLQDFIKLLLKLKSSSCAGYGAGIGAVVYALPGELLAPEDKAVGVSTAQSCRLLTTFVSTKVININI